MIETSTPVNGSCPDGEQCHPAGELATEEDQRFSERVRTELKKISLQPDAATVKRVIQHSLSLKS